MYIPIYKSVPTVQNTNAFFAADIMFGKWEQFFFFGIKAISNRETLGICFIGIYSIPQRILYRRKKHVQNNFRENFA